jgi:hypothetical protein
MSRPVPLCKPVSAADTRRWQWLLYSEFLDRLAEIDLRGGWELTRAPLRSRGGARSVRSAGGPSGRYLDRPEAVTCGAGACLTSTALLRLAAAASVGASRCAPRHSLVTPDATEGDVLVAT